ncbi:hypothetical protein [Rugamonas sp.]|uniref:hypothetical protein n=1 Tax=Rugamonas sp. TaxID=1926287 RepID=UPI0025F1130C|nr:hypothetical protein [Rugamonas sp.]
MPVFKKTKHLGEMHGMLGVQWLRDRHVIVDYNNARLATPATMEDTAAEDSKLFSHGYAGHKMMWDAALGQYAIDGLINGVSAHIGISTVSETVLDTEFAKRAKVQLGPVIDQFGGPSGTLGEVFLSKKQVGFTLDGQHTVRVQPHIFDAYAYKAEKRPAAGSVSTDATIGAEFMLANQAVIDFGSEMLFLPVN